MLAGLTQQRRRSNRARHPPRSSRGRLLPDHHHGPHRLPLGIRQNPRIERQDRPDSAIVESDRYRCCHHQARSRGGLGGVRGQAEGRPGLHGFRVEHHCSNIREFCLNLAIQNAVPIMPRTLLMFPSVGRLWWQSVCHRCGAIRAEGKSKPLKMLLYPQCRTR